MEYVDKLNTQAEGLGGQIEALFSGGLIGVLLTMCVILGCTALVSRLLNRFFRARVARSDKPFVSASIFLNIARIIVWMIGISIVLDVCFNINVSAVIAALGVGGIAVSLGFQDTISNFFGGLQLSVMRLVEPGDYIAVGSDRGIVQDITWRHTQVLTDKNEHVIIPNAVLNKSGVTHVTKDSRQRMCVPLRFKGCKEDFFVAEGALKKACKQALERAFAHASVVEFFVVDETGDYTDILARVQIGASVEEYEVKNAWLRSEDVKKALSPKSQG